jgi:hypothetical protein
VREKNPLLEKAEEEERKRDRKTSNSADARKFVEDGSGGKLRGEKP